MANLIKESTNAGLTVADAAKNMGHGMAQGSEDAGGCVKEKNGMGSPAKGTNAGVAGIKDHMNVIASCGKTVGVVDHVEGSTIKLTKNDSPDCQHHFIPVGWIERVDNDVHLTKNSKETEQGWKSDAASCGCGG